MSLLILAGCIFGGTVMPVTGPATWGRPAMTTQTAAGREPPTNPASKEPFGHTPICRWIETRELDPDRCDKCRWLAAHGQNHS